MYEAFYRLDGIGFRLTPEHRNRFSHRSYRAAYADVIAGTRRGEGFVVLAAGPGAGKTTLVEEVAAHLSREGYSVGKVFNTQVDPDDLLQLVGFAFGVKANAFGKASLLNELERRLAGERPQRRPVLLIVDEAHNLSTAALEELRLLCNLTADGKPLLQILLSGQERLRETLGLPECEPIRQRTVASCTLHPLSAEETRDYIAHGLRLVGWTGDPEIAADALRLLHRYTGGVPRLINLTMGHLLVHGSLREAHRLEARDLESVAIQLGQDGPELFRDTASDAPMPEPMPPLLPLDARAAKGPESGGADPVPSLAPAQARGAGEGPDGGRGTRVRISPGPGRARIPTLAALLTAGVCAALALTVALRGGLSWPVWPVQAPKPKPDEVPSVSGTVRTDPTVTDRRETPLDLALASSLTADLVVGSFSMDHQGSQVPDAAGQAGATEIALGEAARESPPGASGARERVSGDTTDRAPPGGEPAGEARGAERRSEVEDLLAKAERALSIDRLTMPADDNAYAYYQAVLAREPGNAQAAAGIERTVQRYRELGQQSLRRGDWRAARLYASRGLAIWPQDRELLTIGKGAAGPRVATRTKKKRGKRPRGKRPANEISQPMAASEAPDLLERIHTWIRSGKLERSPFLDP